MRKLYWYYRECWILRGFLGLIVGFKYKVFSAEKRSSVLG